MGPLGPASAPRLEIGAMAQLCAQLGSVAGELAEQNKLLDSMGIEKQTINNNDLLRLKTMFEVLMSAKIYTPEQARELAATHLNLTWPED